MAAATPEVPSIAAGQAQPPIPMMRPASLGASVQMASVEQPPVLPFSTQGSAPLDDAELTTANTAPIPAMKSQALQVATAAALPAGNAPKPPSRRLPLSARPVPQPRLHMTNPPAEAVVAAYAPPMPQQPEPQRALEMIIDRNVAPATASAALPPINLPPKTLPPLTAATGLRTASLGGGEPAVGALLGLSIAPSAPSRNRAAAPRLPRPWPIWLRPAPPRSMACAASN